jgi:hypothetical protein
MIDRGDHAGKATLDYRIGFGMPAVCHTFHG